MRALKTYFIGGPNDGHMVVMPEGRTLRALELTEPPALCFTERPPASLEHMARVREVEYEVILRGGNWQVAILPEMMREAY